MIGQDAVQTAVSFDEAVGIDGVVLSKLDGDARGGAALSVVTVTGKPILFASVGEKLTELETFHPDRMASRILDMGDVMTLIEQAEKAFDAEQAARMAGKVAKGDDFTLEDFLEQMMSIKKMGSLTKILGMLPGMGEMKAQLDQFDDRELDKVAAIIRSMTPAERNDHSILNGSRRARIARGAGVEVSAVNQLVERFVDAQKMMRQMRNGGGMPGMPGMPGGGGKRAKAKQKPQAKAGKGAKKSGNPAKRAQQDGAAPAAADALPGSLGGFDPADLEAQLGELPPEFRNLLGK
jgi:signal recognition particle subunit SRP54